MRNSFFSIKIWDEKSTLFDKLCQLLIFLSLFFFEAISLYKLVRFKDMNFLDTAIDIFIVSAPLFSIIFSVDLYKNIKHISSKNRDISDLDIHDIKAELSLINEAYLKKRPYYFNILISCLLLFYSASAYFLRGNLNKYELFIDIIVFISLSYMTFQARAHKRFSDLAKFLLKNSELG